MAEALPVVGTDDECELVLRISFLKFGQCVDGVTGDGQVALKVGDTYSGYSLGGNLCHAQAVGVGSDFAGVLLFQGIERGDQQPHFVNKLLTYQCLCQFSVSPVDGVVGTSIDAYSHGAVLICVQSFDILLRLPNERTKKADFRKKVWAFRVNLLPLQKNPQTEAVYGMKIRQLIGALEEFAPLALQDGYDNAGLQIGLAEDADVSGALLCLDVTEDVLDEAIRRGCNLVVSHHPLLFRPLKSVAGRDYIERCVMKAIKNDITVYAAHTNLDSARGGVNSKIAEKLGLQRVQWLSPKEGYDAGEGVYGYLPEPMEREDFQAWVKELFDVDALRYNSWKGETVQKVAVCGGAGNFLIPTAVKKGCDAFLTGEVGYHRFFGHENELLLLELGHYESEQFTVEVLRDIIKKVAPELPVYQTEVRTNPVHYL